MVNRFNNNSTVLALRRIEQVLRPYHQLQEKMSKAMEPQRRLQEKISKAIEPQRRLQEQIAKAMEPQRRFQEQMANIVEPQRRLQEKIAKFMEPSHQFQEKIAILMEPQRRLQEQITKAMEPQRRFQEQIAKAMEPHRRFREQIEKIMEPQRQMQEQMAKYFEPLNAYISELENDTFTINNDGSFTVSNQTVSIKDVNESVALITVEDETGENFLAQFFDWLEKLKPPVRFVVLCLILPYFIAIVANLTTPIYEEWWRDYIGSEVRVTKKEIIRSATDLYRTDELKKYRFVSASILNVREDSNKKSLNIDELPIGKVVMPVEKFKRWTLIEYQDDDTSIIKRGWVFSRYLSKFER